MGWALMAEELDRGEYTPFGIYSFKLMIDRNIKNPTELARRIEAKGGYPRRISGQTVGNYFKGLHSVPWEFLQYQVAVFNDADELTDAELEALGTNYAWRQKKPGAGGVTVDNAKRAQQFIKDIEARRKNSDGRGNGPGDQRV